MKQQIYNTVIYLRLSRDDELHGESASISTQRQMLAQYCQETVFASSENTWATDGWKQTTTVRSSCG